MTFAGGLNAGAQALGTSNATPFTIATNNVTRVTVGSGGGITVNSGGIAVTDGNITIQGSAGKVTAAASTVAGDGDKTLATKDYVDSQRQIAKYTCKTIRDDFTTLNNYANNGNSDQYAGTSVLSLVTNISGTALNKKLSTSDILIGFPPMLFDSVDALSNNKTYRILIRVTLTYPGAVSRVLDIPIYESAETIGNLRDFTVASVRIPVAALGGGTYNWAAGVSGLQFYNSTTQTPKPGDVKTESYPTTGLFTITGLAIYGWCPIWGPGSEAINFRHHRRTIAINENLFVYEAI